MQVASVGITEFDLGIEELDAMVAPVDWYRVGKAIGTAARVVYEFFVPK